MDFNKKLNEYKWIQNLFNICVIRCQDRNNEKRGNPEMEKLGDIKLALQINLIAL